jgi:hypothetical protein
MKVRLTEEQKQQIRDAERRSLPQPGAAPGAVEIKKKHWWLFWV